MMGGSLCITPVTCVATVIGEPRQAVILEVGERVAACEGLIAQDRACCSVPCAASAAPLDAVVASGVPAPASPGTRETESLTSPRVYSCRVSAVESAGAVLCRGVRVSAVA